MDWHIHYPKKQSSEIQILCACCRVKPTDADLKLQAKLAPLIHADALIWLAIRHRIEPLLYHNLKQHAVGVFSSEILDKLAIRVQQNAVKSLNALRINLQLTRLMRTHDIPYLPLKGVTLAQQYYGEISLRHANDIDFYVPERSVTKVRALLLKQGCTQDSGHDFQDIEARGERHSRFLRRIFHHDVLIHPDGEHLELHWRIVKNLAGLRLNPTDLLLSAESIVVAGDSIKIIEPISLLLYLCDHGARHGWYRLKWLMDLPQVLESRDWDWLQVLVDAKRANCFSALLLGLKLAQLMFGWVPPDVVAEVMEKQRLLNWQVKMVYQNLNKPERALASPTAFHFAAHLVYRMSLIESYSFLWGELAHYFLSPNDLRVVRLPDRLFLAYYALRPILLIWRRVFEREQISHAG
ncbi:MAG: nucleotidyltransferase family protein [Gallionellaceae bacterium]|jgi:hypothetical protein